jgi:hypothetical protein
MRTSTPAIRQDCAPRMLCTQPAAGDDVLSQNRSPGRPLRPVAFGAPWSYSLMASNTVTGLSEQQPRLSLAGKPLCQWSHCTASTAHCCAQALGGFQERCRLGARNCGLCQWRRFTDDGER